MFDFSVAAGLSFTAQIITAAVMAFLLAGFYRQYQKSYVWHWMLSWTALAVSQLAFVAARMAAVHSNVPPIHPLRIVPAVAAVSLSYLYVAWIAFGAYELIRRRPVRLREAKQTLALLAIGGAITALLFTGADASPGARHFARSGVFGIVSGAAFVGVAIVLWRSRRRPAVGMTVLSLALGAHAVQQLQQALLAFVSMRAGEPLLPPAHDPYIELLLLSLIGLGMIAALLEDEREAAALAADQVEHLAYHDALTGLPNRPLFMDRLIMALAQANRANQKLAVFFLDLDRFKDINDSLGHSVGDTLLKSVADRVRRCVREGDTVARFGGDEFTLLIPKVDKIEDTAKIAEKIIETIRTPFVINEQELYVTTSIGVAIYPSDGLDAETLVRNSDAAMYRAKDQGRDNYQLYASEMNAQAVERLALESTLRAAIGRKQLVLYYQPVVAAGTGSIVGVEALIRWKHPKRGLLSPAHFIALAEASGLIVPIGEWVMRSACRQLKAWEKRINRPLTMAVNLSARQFQHPDIVTQIRSAIEDAGVEPSTIEIEITESSAMQNVDNAVFTLREMKELGVRISMDDFGTGYSSLNYLKRFPIDTLKLDQTFVRDVMTDERDAAIVGAVIVMAHRLGLKVVAEGVETHEQLEYLRLEGCDYIQGYLFSGPVSSEEIEPLLLSRKGDLMPR
ncbi:MAG TPA: EAL domain-containing protein [Thermoanaerobaculia bacterium]|nr:EAL domain-containing protein [Thermoanaerobaculia bacterium]